MGAGLQLTGLGNGLNPRAEYEGDFLAHAAHNMGALRLSIDFQSGGGGRGIEIGA